jgi:hypothetical protein
MFSKFISVIRRTRSSRGSWVPAYVALAAVILCGGPSAAEAKTKDEQKSKWEFIVPSGTLIPTGAQEGTIKRGDLTAVQLLYVLRPNLAITGTFGWARSKDIASVGAPKLDIFTYDLGTEFRTPKRIIGRGISFSSFAGAGAGARTYSYRNLNVSATFNPAAYVSAGGELSIRRVRLRLEVRDYVTGFKPLNGGGSSAVRNDVAVMLGLRI